MSLIGAVRLFRVRLMFNLRAWVEISYICAGTFWSEAG